MKKIVWLVLVLVLVGSYAMAKDLDPIPGVDVNEDGITTTADAIVELGETYPIVQTSTARNSGTVTSRIEYVEGKLKLPRGSTLTMQGEATGNLYTATVEDAGEGFPTAIITSQKNTEEARIHSVGNFGKPPMKGETRVIKASGNSITYESKNTNNEE